MPECGKRGLQSYLIYVVAPPATATVPVVPPQTDAITGLLTIVAIAFGTALRAIAMSPRRKGDTSCDRFDVGVIWRETQRNLRILSGGICS